MSSIFLMGVLFSSFGDPMAFTIGLLRAMLRSSQEIITQYIVHISGKGRGGYSPECACSTLLVGQVCFSPCQIPYRPSSVRDQCCLVMLLQQGFQISTCLMARAVSPYKIDPKFIPSCPSMTSQICLDLVLLFF